MNHESAIALIGMSGRFPGARDVGEFWRHLQAGVETISRFGAAELLAAGVDPALAQHPDFVPARGVISDGDRFDREFFGYSAAEAAGIDPQHRVFLECAAQALDDAAIDPERVGEWTGVYAGCDLTPSPDHGPSDPALATQRIIGREKDFLATRVAYKLGLRGPAVTVQTACSTALVCVHQACRALLGYECDVALAGGVSLRLPEAGGYLYQEGGILSRDGRCRAFDAAADGTVSSGGVGVVVLKRLDDALADEDRIIAVIRGSAVNNDGAEKVGYTAPSVAGQRDVIRMALAQAGIEAGTVGYVEAHGTGTAVGDPVELAALAAAFGTEGDRTTPCLIGTAKANIGHTGAAAGIAGLIKTALMLQHRTFVPTPHFTRANPALNLAETSFRISTEHQEWESEGPRRAGVSSFGIGGTNAHVLLEEAPGARHRPPRGASPGQPRALCLSAATPQALHTLRRQLADRLAAEDAPRLAEAAQTLAGRRQFPHRLTVVAETTTQAAERLRAHDRATEAQPRPTAAFLFPGQGELRAGHGRAAHALLPVFREVFEECGAQARERFGVDLIRALDPSTGPAWFTDTRHQQLGLFVHGYALARQLAHWGVTPAAMFGHSVGEYVAATVAGVWSWQDALGLVWQRATAMRDCAPGRMVALRLPPSRAASLHRDGITLAVAGEEHVVLSGPAEPIERLAAAQRAEGIGTRLLDTEHAFHSPLMADAAEALRNAAATAPAAEPRLPYVSNLTGTWAEAARVGDPDYWADQLLSPVRLGDGMRTLADADAHLLVQLGPGDALTREAVRRAPGSVPVALLGRDPDREPTSLLEALARLWEEGVDIDWAALAYTEPATRCSLPPHPFTPTLIETPARPTGSPAPATAVSAPPAAADSVVNTPRWSESPIAPSGAHDAVLLVGDPEPALTALAEAAVGEVRRAAVIRAPWEPAAVEAAVAALTARSARTPLLLAALPAEADPTDRGTRAVLDVLAAARRLGGPLLLAGRALADVLGEGECAPGAAALLAWAEHHGRPHPPVALLDLGTGDGPFRPPVVDSTIAAYAWRGRRWWARTPRPVPLPVKDATTTSPEAPAQWTLVADGRPDGAGIAADLAEHGLWLHDFVDLTPPQDRSALVAAAVANAPWNSVAEPLTRRARLGRDLDRYCAALVGRQVLAMTGLSAGQRLADDELRHRIDPDRRLSDLVGFCLRILAEEGWLRHEDDGWRAADGIADDLAAALRGGEALAELPGLRRMLDRVTAAYPDVFAGRRTPVSVLYPEAQGDFLHDCLRDNRIPLDDNVAALDALRAVVRATTTRSGDAGPLRVLEIGAGTGRLTWPLLTDWPGRDGVEYHFTDVSPLIVRRAEAHAAELGLSEMRFSTFDIGQEPAAQGLASGSYDLVLGYNVVHVASSVPHALRRLAGLLRPGGWLGLVEVTRIPRWSHVLWGLAPGWWDFADELRTDSIHLDAKSWLRALAEAGFTDVSPVPASMEGDHLAVLAARPGPDSQAPERHAQGASSLLYLPGLDRIPRGAERWESLRTAIAPPGAAWVVTEAPADWQTQRVRRQLDPAADDPAWGHLDTDRLRAPDVAALLGHGQLPPGVVQVTGALTRPDTPQHAPEPVDESPQEAAGPEPAGEAAPETIPARSPQDPLGTKLAQLWCEVLGTPTVTHDDDFHRLGGDSLMLVQLAGLIRSRLGHTVTVAGLAGELTFARLVTAVREAAGDALAPRPTVSAPSAHDGDLVLLREGGSLAPLFLIPPASGSSLCYQEFSAQLDVERPVYGVEAPGLHDGRRPPTRLTQIAAHHVRAIRRVQPRGPYLLGGWSFGAMVAHQMARLLEASGERVELLIGIDGFLPPTKGLPVGVLPSWLLPSVGLQLEARIKRGRSRVLAMVRPLTGDQDARAERAGEVARIGEVAGVTTAGLPDYVRVHNASITAMLLHRPQPVSTGLLLLKAGADEALCARLTTRLGSLYGAGVTARPVPGDHWSVLGRRHAPDVAAEIRRALAGRE